MRILSVHLAVAGLCAVEFDTPDGRDHVSILWIIIIVVLVLLILGFFGRGRFGR